jgi:PhnB protein
MSFAPYIHFTGTCERALAFYAEVFGVEDLSFMRSADAPPESGTSALVVHGHVTLGGSSLMARDYPPGMEGAPQQSVSISFSVTTSDEGKTIFERLLEGGEEIMARQPTFFSTGFGMVKDRFGTHWIIAAPGPGAG